MNRRDAGTKPACRRWPAGGPPVPSVPMARTPRPRPQPRRPSSSGGGGARGGGGRAVAVAVRGGAAVRRRRGGPRQRGAWAATRSRDGRPSGSSSWPGGGRCGSCGSPPRTVTAARPTSSPWPPTCGCPCSTSAASASTPRPAARRPRACWPRPRPLQEADLDDLARGSAKRPPFLVLVDGVTDPGNLGAILRSVEGAGGTGIVLPRHRAVHITPTAAKAAAGAIEHVPDRGRVRPADGHRAAAPGRGLGGRPRRRRRRRASSIWATPRPSPSRSSSARRAPACLGWCGSAATCWSASRCGVACRR